MDEIAMIALTDYEWYNSLNRVQICNEVNFWTPTPWNVKKLEVGQKVFFLLKKQYGRKVCGYGTFREYMNMSVEDAWNKYGLANGVENLMKFKERISGYTNKNSGLKFTGIGHIIGCIILNDVAFYDEKDQFEPQDRGWDVPDQIVKYKYVPLFKNVIMSSDNLFVPSFQLVDGEKKHKKVVTTERGGQNKFRQNLFQVYQGKCCITQESLSTVLEAAHIQNYISNLSNHVQNGLLLRVDFHQLFDAGLFTIDDTYVIQVSPYLSSTYYKKYHGKKIVLPEEEFRPSQQALKWHYQNVFRK